MVVIIKSMKIEKLKTFFDKWRIFKEIKKRGKNFARPFVFTLPVSCQKKGDTLLTTLYYSNYAEYLATSVPFSVNVNG